ncbi:MAG: hypothetical protein GY772_28930 [bacterium]|nr:hypothetical protein [bacterium]
MAVYPRPPRRVPKLDRVDRDLLWGKLAHWRKMRDETQAVKQKTNKNNELGRYVIDSAAEKERFALLVLAHALEDAALDAGWFKGG